MSSIPSKDGAERLPPGFVAIGIGPGATGPLEICAVVKKEADPVRGHPVVLRDLIDAQVFLGCIVDRGGRLLSWLELWIQNVDQLAGVPSTCRQALTNSLLDERWMGYFESLRDLDSDLIIETGWEREHPPPVFLDLEKLAPLEPADPSSGKLWKLCEDDALLAAKGFPTYSSSTHRYLYVPELEQDTTFVPVTADAPTNEFARPLAKVTNVGAAIPLNPGGGLILVRSYSPIGFEAFADVLGGRSWDGVTHGRTEIEMGESTRLLAGTHRDESNAGGRLFLGRHGKWGRFVESFHLKLGLLTGVAAAVEAFVRHTQRPLLNLRPDSFQLEFGRPAERLPFFWTASAALVDPGDAVVLPVESTDECYYLIGRSGGSSIYRPESAQEPVQSSGTVRIRQIVEGRSGSGTIEGTLSTQERLHSSPSDLLWLRLNVGGKRVNLYARLETEAAMAAGEWRFRTLGQALDDDLLSALRAAEGVPVRDTQFEFLPLLSSPCDLHALAVLAVRTLLVNSRKALPIALDDVLSLSRQVANKHDEALSLSKRIGRVFDEDDKWAELLGPHLLVEDEVSSAEAFDLVTPDLWWNTLAMIVKAFPGIGPDSTCADYGSAQTGSIHKVFEQILADLNLLLLHTRSLIVIDWRFNREIHSVIRGHRSLPQEARNEASPEESLKK